MTRAAFSSQLHNLRQDFVYACRRLLTTPVFTLFAILTLAFSVGVNTALFSFVNGILLKPIAIPNVDRLVVIHAPRTSADAGSRHVWIEDVRNRQFVHIDRVSTFSMLQAAVRVGDRTSVVWAEAVSGSYFSILGVHPVVGRLLDSNDDLARDGDVVVVSERFWRQHFAGEGIGRRMAVAGRPVTIVGVVPAEFRGLEAANMFGRDLWFPRRVLSEGTDELGPNVLAMLRPAASLELARAEIRTLSTPVASTTSRSRLQLNLLAARMSSYPPVFYAAAVATLAASALGLVITCANLLNLLLARVSGRRAELAIRVMMGASQARVTQLLGAETLIIVTASGGVGVLFGSLATQALKGALFQDWGGMMPYFDVSIDWRVFVYAFVLIAVTAAGIVSSLAARAFAIGALTVTALAGGAGGATQRGVAMRAKLIAVQMTSSIVLLAVAALLVRSSLDTLSEHSNLDTRHAVTGWIDHGLQRHDRLRAAALNRALLSSLPSAAGVANAALSSSLPGGGYRQLTRVAASSEDGSRQTWGATAALHGVTADFFSAIGLPLRRGQTLSAADQVVVSEAVATRLWPNLDPVGRWLQLQEGDTDSAGPARRVVGLVPDVALPEAPPGDRYAVYVPFADDTVSRVTIVIRGPASSAALAESLQQAVHQVNPDLAIVNVHSLSEELGASYAAVRAAAVLISPLGILGVVIASVGLYGLVSFMVGQRRRELAIMKVLGATDGALYASAAHDVVKKMLLGVVPGVMLAALAGQLLHRYVMTNLRPFDWAAFILVPAGVFVVGVLACVLPVRQLLRREPYAALKDS